MRNRLILIAGGSGSGKSTLAVSLHKAYPEAFALLQADDYYKAPEDAPKLPDGKLKWDTPEALRFDDLVRDVQRLLNGTAITILTKSELHNPGYRTALKNKIECTIEPRPVLIMEGYLTLYDVRLRNLASLSIYLDMPIEDSIYRRSSNKFDASAQYLESVLIPAHRLFVEPTRRYADEILAVVRLSEEKTLGIVEGILKARGFLN